MTYSTAPAPFDGVIVIDGTDYLFSKKAAAAGLYSPSCPTEIARDVYLFAKPIAVIGSAGKAALKATDVDESQDGTLILDPTTAPGAFEGLLKRFNFPGR